ncbi:hypothetical protein [uncultured Alloprevotella sp.]|uniref:hypothetical protein n=1 Tax=uncultured Alloprevotella sp. TaxID=1283315 RepID=UPI0026209ED5|nr:hypothetical protein [uncultured Alloprevotella sp.]
MTKAYKTHPAASRFRKCRERVCWAQPSSVVYTPLLVDGKLALRLLPPNDGLLSPNDGLLSPNDGLLPPNQNKQRPSQTPIGLNKPAMRAGRRQRLPYRSK